jgi:hypothetical protein
MHQNNKISTGNGLLTHEWREDRDKVALVRTLLGSCALVVAATCTHPFDMIKVRLQKQGELLSAAIEKTSNSSNNKKYKNMLHGLQAVYRQEGLRAVYKGSVSACGGIYRLKKVHL